jgi:glycosyltransferase involved in cell wall biosynthesis
MLAPIYRVTFSGAAYMPQVLRDSAFVQRFQLTHINTRFVNAVSELEKFNLTKCFLLLKYLAQLIVALVVKRPHWIIVCPAFSPGAFLKDSIYTVVCAKLFRRNVIWWAHAWGFRRLYDGSRVWFQSYMRWVSAQVSCVVTVGSRQPNDFALAFASEKLFTINCGVPVEQYSLSRFQDRSGVRVLYFANLEVTKGWRVLLRAAQKVCGLRTNIGFDFYGNPTENSSPEDIRRAFETTGYTDRIVYHGPAYGHEKHLAFERADIFCFPTFFRFETFGIVNLEAMNAGLPIITTNHASIPDAVVDGRGGFLVPKEDSEALLSAILRLADDPNLRQHMGEYNQQRFVDHFTVEKFAERWIQFMGNVGASI